MVWFLVDDVLPFHERVLRAGNAAMGLWVRAGAWCSGQLTDGFIPTDVARALGSTAEVRKLVAVGLWEEDERDGQAGYLFHAWAEDGTGQKRQPTKAEVEDRRRKDREKKARQRQTAQGLRDLPPEVLVPEGVPGGHPEGVGTTKPYQANPSPLAPLEGGTPPVDNSGEISEPPVRCPRHLGLDRPPACGACKDARLAHERWETRQILTAPAPAPRAPRWDPTTHCEHGQRIGACDACDYEAHRVGELIVADFGRGA